MPYSNDWIAALVNLGVELHSEALGHCSSGMYGFICNAAKLGPSINQLHTCANKLCSWCEGGARLKALGKIFFTHPDGTFICL